MKTATRRVVFTVAAGVALAAAAAPAPAQQTTETTTTYAAESSSAGLYVALTPPGEEEPAVAIVGAGTEGSVTSDGPAAAGQADALALAGESPVQATTSAPPDESDSAESPIPAIEIPNVGTIGALQGQASSSSEAEDGTPTTENDAGFAGVDIDLALPELGPLGTVGGSVSVAQASTQADAGAPQDTDVAAEAGSSGISVGLDVDISVLEQLCANLPAGPLQDACNSLAQQDAPVLADVSVGVSDVRCGWDGESADCDGSGAVVVVELLGQDPVEVAPGQTVTIPEEGPFLVRASAGAFTEETTSNPDSASAIATGVSVELLGADPALPGLVTVQLGQSTAAVSGDVEEERVIARTGAPLAPIFLGGSALVAAGLGLRRFLRRR
ncbi:MAG TPA: hypothetical protein VHL78_08905 [Actinomycetota bacterium]|nr:hypothetical protein [Actinomycetota bacterium]